MRGCNQPAVVLGVACAPLGVRGEGVGAGGAERRGVRWRMGRESVDVDDVVVVVRVSCCCCCCCCCELEDWVRAVEDMINGMLLG